MRDERSSRLDMQGQMPMARIGGFGGADAQVGSAWLDVECRDDDAHREGSEGEVATAATKKRSARKARNTQCRERQSQTDNHERWSRLQLEDAARWVLPSAADTGASLTPTACRRWLVADAGPSRTRTCRRRCRCCATFAMPSHHSHPSHARPPMPVPKTMSPRTSANSVLRHPFSRSSVGSSRASTPCASS